MQWLPRLRQRASRCGTRCSDSALLASASECLCIPGAPLLPEQVPSCTCSRARSSGSSRSSSTGASGALGLSPCTRSLVLARCASLGRCALCCDCAGLSYLPLPLEQGREDRGGVLAEAQVAPDRSATARSNPRPPTRVPPAPARSRHACAHDAALAVQPDAACRAASAIGVNDGTYRASYLKKTKMPLRSKTILIHYKKTTHTASVLAPGDDGFFPKEHGKY